MISKDIIKHELIGSMIEVVKAKNKMLIGLKGKVVDETRNLISIDNNGTTKRLIKDQVTLRLWHKGHTYEVNGKLLVNRPEDRLKKMRKLS